MSAILSADDLNDFISPGVACIKPVETLPKEDDSNPYEVTTEDKVQAQNPAPASISLTDCLACSGCVTSAEAVLVSLQSHTEVLNTLDAYSSIDAEALLACQHDSANSHLASDAKLFVASVSPQARASIAATFGISERRAGNIIEQFLSGSQGLRIGGKYNSGFAYVVDTNRMREACLVLAADEVAASVADKSRPRPILTSACPGWVCYAEKTHPHVLPHLSALKSPQALTGTLLKSVLSKTLGIRPSQIWHLAIMPCFDKKLEASREELTHKWWSDDVESSPVRDVDCVITPRELLTLADARGIALAALPRTPVRSLESGAFPDQIISSFLSSTSLSPQTIDFGTSGGYLTSILLTQQSLHPGSKISAKRGRNADVVEYVLESSSQEQILKFARYYGFKNIQNLVRKLQPARQSKLPGAARRTANTSNSATDYAYIEVMACPGGCTNGGGQIKIEDVADIISQTRGETIDKSTMATATPLAQKEWLARVDEAYFSADSDVDTDEGNNSDTNSSEMTDVRYENGNTTNTIEKENDNKPNNTPTTTDPSEMYNLLAHWSQLTNVSLDKLTTTTFRKVESDVGKKSVAKKMGDSERIAAIAGLQGGGW